MQRDEVTLLDIAAAARAIVAFIQDIQADRFAEDLKIRSAASMGGRNATAACLDDIRPSAAPRSFTSANSGPPDAPWPHRYSLPRRDVAPPHLLTQSRLLHQRPAARPCIPASGMREGYCGWMKSNGPEDDLRTQRGRRHRFEIQRPAPCASTRLRILTVGASLRHHHCLATG